MKESDTITILGNGSSLLSLTDEQKDAIRATHVIAMNKYLPFWKLVGIVPDSYLFLPPNRTVIQILANKAVADGITDTVFYLGDSRFKHKSNYEAFIACAPNLTTYPVHRRNPTQAEINAAGKDEQGRPKPVLIWSGTPTGPFGRMGGTLPVALNLADALFRQWRIDGSKIIRLIGFDGDNRYFYDEHIPRDAACWKTPQQWADQAVDKPNPTVAWQRRWLPLCEMMLQRQGVIVTRST